MKNTLLAACLSIALFVPMIATASEDFTDLAGAITTGKPTLEVRERYENVEQDNKLENANADTVRARLGYLTNDWNGLTAFLEYEGVVAIGGQSYNSTVNNKVNYSAIADPTGSQLNQAYLNYHWNRLLAAKIGRQTLAFDNERFIGTTGFRQTEVVFDAYTATITPTVNSDLTYTRLTNMNNAVYQNIGLEGDLLNAHYTPGKWLTIAGYGYWLNFNQNITARRDTRTVGARASGKLPVLSSGVTATYAFEYAYQSHYADSPDLVSARYLLGEIGASYKLINGKIGYEILGGDGQYGFQTPLATLHAFQGWADLFLATPSNGIKDEYASLGGGPGWLKAIVTYHEFRADQSTSTLNYYGNEWDGQLSHPVGKHLMLGLTYANYNRKDYSADTKKIWAWMEFKL